MTEIHYFPRYSQPENFVTNNTLLLLLRLNQYNRFKFQRFMEQLCANEELQLATSWLHFRQQRGTGKSVLDGFISQDSIKIAVETKLTDSFDVEQLENHLTIFGSEQHKLLLLLSPTLGAVPASLLGQIRGLVNEQNIQVVHTSFENIVDKMKSCLSEHDEEMLALVDDYEAFCSDMELLPRDKHTMIVPPCRESLKDNLNFRLYYCTASYSRRNVQYLGVYANKAVQAIGRISKIVSCDVSLSENKVIVENESVSLTADEERRIIEATRNGPSHGWDLATGHRFFLCDKLIETEFRKNSSGGIQGRRYFDLEELFAGQIPKSVEEIAQALRQRTWE
jgi:hypothetical protein